MLWCQPPHLPETMLRCRCPPLSCWCQESLRKTHLGLQAIPDVKIIHTNMTEFNAIAVNSQYPVDFSAKSKCYLSCFPSLLLRTLSTGFSNESLELGWILCVTDPSPLLFWDIFLEPHTYVLLLPWGYHPLSGIFIHHSIRSSPPFIGHTDFINTVEEMREKAIPGTLARAQLHSSFPLNTEQKGTLVWKPLP